MTVVRHPASHTEILTGPNVRLKCGAAVYRHAFRNHDLRNDSLRSFSRGIGPRECVCSKWRLGADHGQRHFIVKLHVRADRAAQFQIVLRVVHLGQRPEVHTVPEPDGSVQPLEV